MGTEYNPTITKNGLVLYLDAANTRSYAGSGNTAYNLALTSSIGATLSAGVTFSTNPSTFVATASNLLLSDYNLGYVARLESSTSIRFSRGGDGIGIAYTNAALVSANFNHYAFVKNASGTDSYIYINGIQRANGSINNVSITKPFVFNGRWLNDGTNVSTGDAQASQFSNISVYDRALSAQEVLQNYNSTKKRYGL